LHYDLGLPLNTVSTSPSAVALISRSRGAELTSILTKIG
jgi:hypothetical protein